MKAKILTIIMLCGVMYGYAQNTPPHAASTQTWTFGKQTWSDAIHLPECNNKELFENNSLVPVCRSYTEDGKTRFYYNWAYMDANKNRMCPSPWRIPTKDDFENLASQASFVTVANFWGYGGYAHNRSMLNVSEYALYWSSRGGTIGKARGSANYLFCLSYTQRVGYGQKYYGYQVRCVK